MFPGLNTVYCECECRYPSHLVKFELFEHKDGKEMCVSVQLKHWQSWYKRLWIGIKYIFGKQEVYGHWDSFLITRTDSDKIIDIMERFRNE